MLPELRSRHALFLFGDLACLVSLETTPSHAGYKTEKLDIKIQGPAKRHQDASTRVRRVPVSPSSSELSQITFIPNLTGDLEDGLGKALDVAGGDTGDGDTAVLGGINGVLKNKINNRTGPMERENLPPWRGHPFARASGQCRRTCRSNEN